MRQTTKTRDYVPRSVMDREIETLSERAAKAESCVVYLLDKIDPGLLERHGYDWYAATMEIVG